MPYTQSLNEYRLYTNTNNIDKLIHYCSMIPYRVPEIFFPNNEENERLFQLLQKAYIGIRYKEIIFSMQ